MYTVDEEHAECAHRRGAVKLVLTADAPEEFSADHASSSGTESLCESDLENEEVTEVEDTNISNNSNHRYSSQMESGASTTGNSPQDSSVGRVVSTPVLRRIAAFAIPSYASPTASMLATQLAHARGGRSRGASTTGTGAPRGKTGNSGAEVDGSPCSGNVSKKASKNLSGPERFNLLNSHSASLVLN
jgi:hypothetical protein